MKREQILGELMEFRTLREPGEDEFTASQYAESQGISTRTAREHLSNWVQQGFATSRRGIDPVNKHPTTCYKVTDMEALRRYLLGENSSI